jgi:hypothetical protein
MNGFPDRWTLQIVDQNRFCCSHEDEQPQGQGEKEKHDKGAPKASRKRMALRSAGCFQTLGIFTLWAVATETCHPKANVPGIA